MGEIDYMLRTRELIKAAMHHIAKVDNWLQAVSADPHVVDDLSPMTQLLGELCLIVGAEAILETPPSYEGFARTLRKTLRDDLVSDCTLMAAFANMDVAEVRKAVDQRKQVAERWNETLGAWPDEEPLVE